MNTWTQQMGFPVVNIIRDGDTITATQKRFLTSPRDDRTNISQPKSPFNYKWYVPLNCYTNKEPPDQLEAWMNMTNGNICKTIMPNIYILYISIQCHIVFFNYSV